ncbi:MAG: PAS domain-containing protein, partial [Cyanobacteria bacterium J06632_3]
FNEKELGIAIEIALNKHQQEQIIHSSERWYATAFQSINDAVVGTDLVGNIVFMNAAAESMTGWTMSDVIDRPLVEILAFHRKIRQFDNIALRHSVSSILTAALRGNDAVPFPHCAQLLTKSLQIISVEGDATALRDSTGQIIGSIFVFRKSLFEPAIDDQAEAAEPLSRVSVTSLTSREDVGAPYQQDYLNSTSIDETVSKELGQTNHTSQKEKKYLAGDTAIVADFTRAFIAGKSVALSSPNLIASSNSGVTMLSSRAEGIIVRIATIGDELTAIVKQSSTYQPLIRHILIENSFFPISRRTGGHCHYQRRDIPEQCQIYHAGGAELWTAWHGRTTIEPVGGGVSIAKLSRSNIIVLRRGHWHRIQKMMMKSTGWHIKTIGGEIFVPPDDSLIWGIQGWPLLTQDS